MGESEGFSDSGMGDTGGFGGDDGGFGGTPGNENDNGGFSEGIGGFGNVADGGSLGGVSITGSPDASFAEGSFSGGDGTGLGGLFSSSPEMDMNSWGVMNALAQDLGYSTAVPGNISLANPDAMQSSGFMETFSKLLNNPVLSFILNQNPVLGKLGQIGKSAMAGSKGTAQGNVAMGQGLLGTIGGILGSVAGPVGSAIGANALGSMANSFAGITANQGMTAADVGTATAGTGSGMDLGSGLLGLGGLLYGNYKNRQDLGKQIGGLQGLFSQNSPYAQQLRQQLERRDAAAGRRSQYGPREVELQAKLAQLASQQAPTLAGLYQSQAQNRNRNLATLGFLYNQMGGMRGISDKLGGLGGMFGGFGGGNMDWADTGGFGTGSDYGYQDLGSYF